MKACFFLMHYMMTWLRPIKWMLWLSVPLLLVAAALGVAGERASAFGFALFAGVPLLVFPYLFAWHGFRTMLGSRRLTLLPGFRLRLTFALFLLTAMLTLYVPLMSLLFWHRALPPGLPLAIFLVATVFALTMQWAVASPVGVFVYSLGPFALIYVVGKVWPVLFLIFYRAENAPALLLVAVLAWGLALRMLTSRRSFQPPRKAPLHFRDYVWDGRSDVFGILAGNYKGPVKSAEGTLLLGAPDGFSGRFFIMLNLVCLSPLMGMGALYLTGFGAVPASSPEALAGMFLTFSLTTTLIYGFGNGEHASRCRLLWLRLGGSRARYWQRLERRVVADTAMLALIVVPITGAILMLFDSATFDPIWYCAVALAGNVLCNYFSLAARLRQWSYFLQLLTAAGMTLGFVVGSVFDVLPLPVLVALILGLALLFRQQALQSFAAVDWQQLRPAGYQTAKAKLS